MHTYTFISLCQGDPVGVKTDSVIKRSPGKLNYYSCYSELEIPRHRAEQARKRP